MIIYLGGAIPLFFYRMAFVHQDKPLLETGRPRNLFSPAGEILHLMQSAGRHVYMDIEFGYVYGTSREVMMPIEIGAVLHRPEDESLSYAAEQFRYDLDVEIWKKMTDPCGRTAGVETTVSNLSRGECGMPYDHSYRLPDDEVETAEMTAQRAFSDLRDFLESIVSRKGATAIIVFAASMERRAFRAAGFSPDGCAFVDLQREIRRRLKMKQFLSLDRLACMIGFSTDGATISSAHFQYPVPQGYLHLLGAHRGLGDAVRTFLVAREFQEHLPYLGERIRNLVETGGGNGEE